MNTTINQGVMLVYNQTGVAVRELQTERNISLAKKYIEEGLLDGFRLEGTYEYLKRRNLEILNETSHLEILRETRL